MSDLIDRKEAVEAIKNEMLSWLEGDSHDYRKVVDAIMDLPTVEAIPIDWIEKEIEKSKGWAYGDWVEHLIHEWKQWGSRKDE